MMEIATIRIRIKAYIATLLVLKNLCPEGSK